MSLDALASVNNPMHSNLLHADELCARLAQARVEQEKVCILPDFDCDGVMSAVVSYAAMRSFGIDAELFVPNPNAGYGFTAGEVDRLVAEHPGVSVVFTCDTGIGCTEGVRRMKELGLTVLVTDHHVEAMSDTVRGSADVIVDPCALDETYEHSGICGAHVVWQLMMMFAGRYGDTHDVDLIDRLKVFAGIGTVTDMMPLLYENRQLVNDAVSVCRMLRACGDTWFIDSFEACDEYKEAFRGLYAAIDVWYRLDARHVNQPESICESFFGFNLGPMINSAKRVGGDMSRVYGLFTNCNHRADAEYLFELNTQRKAAVARYLAEIGQQDNPYAPYVYTSDADKGLIGLLAGDIERKANVPVVVVRRDEETGGWGGSGRSPAWFPFLKRMGVEGAPPIWARGHEGAFGAGFASDDDMRAYFDYMSAEMPRLVAEHAAATSGATDVDINIALDGTGDVGLDVPLFIEFIEDMDRYRPFGASFPAPRVRIRFDAAMSGVSFAFPSGGKHVIVTLPFGVQVIGWGQGDFFEGRAKRSGMVQLTGELGISRFRDEPQVTLTGEFENPRRR